jgi:predicted permease
VAGLQEFGQALRGLRRDPGFALIVLLSLGLGIGATVSVFTLVDQALLRLLPVKSPGQLVQVRWQGEFLGMAVGSVTPGQGEQAVASTNVLSNPLYRELEQDARSQRELFNGVFAQAPILVNVAGGEAPEPLEAELVSGTYFSVLGVGAARGRLLAPADDQRPGEHPVVVLSFDHWKNRLGAPADIVGRRLMVNGRSMSVVGVAAAGFRGIDPAAAPALWIPRMMSPQLADFGNWLDNWRGAWLQVFARLRPGVSREQAQARMGPWWKAMLAADLQRPGWTDIRPEARGRYLEGRVELAPAARGASERRQSLARPLLLLLVSTGLLLLLTCLNVANLTLARSLARAQNLAIRSALGASPLRIARHLLVEAALLALGGGLLGLALAPMLGGVLLSFLPPEVALSAAVDGRVLGFALALTMLTAVAFGVLPAWRASRTPPMGAMKRQAAGIAAGLGLRKALLVGQVAVSCVVMIGAGLFTRTLLDLRARGPGFATSNLINFQLDPGRNGLDRLQSKQRLRDLLAAIRALPQVDSAGMSMVRLLEQGRWDTGITVDAGKRETVALPANNISPGFFQALGVSLLAGRDFNDADTEEVPGTRYRSAIINRALADKVFAGRDPLGARVALGRNVGTTPSIEIVGVVPTFQYDGLGETEPQIYFPAVGRGFKSGAFYVRARVPSDVAMAEVRRTIRQLDPLLPIMGMRTLDDQLDHVLRNERMLATLGLAFAALAALLATIGIYGVMSFAVTRRTREIAIRLALGARPGSAIGRVAGESGLLVALGVMIGVPLTWAATRLLASQLEGVQPMGAGTVALVSLVIGLVALVASALPARRAARVDATAALRQE